MHVKPLMADVSPVIANTGTKSNQKQIVKYDIKTEHPEENTQPSLK